MIRATTTFSPCLTDDGPPAASYMAFFVPVEICQFYVDSLTGEYYVCVDNSDQYDLIWKRIPFIDQITGLVTFPDQIQADWSESDTGAPGYVNNKPSIPAAPAARVQAATTRTLGTGFQVDATRDSMVSYSVDIACALSLSGGQTGTVFLEIASDSGFTTNLQEVGRSVNGNAGTLTLGLNTTQTSTVTLTGFVPGGYYCRLRSVNTTGTPTFTYRSGQEIKL